MKLTRDDVLKLARLSRLKLTENEIEEFQNEISSVLGYVNMLKDVDVNGLKPTYQVNGLQNIAREDAVKDYGASKDDLLKNTPQREGDYIKVRRMIG